MWGKGIVALYASFAGWVGLQDSLRTYYGVP